MSARYTLYEGFRQLRKAADGQLFVSIGNDDYMLKKTTTSPGHRVFSVCTMGGQVVAQAATKRETVNLAVAELQPDGNDRLAEAIEGLTECLKEIADAIR